MNITFASLYWHAIRKKIIQEQFILENKKTAAYSVFGILVILLAIPLAYFSTYLSFALGIIIFTGHLFKKK
jgi:hypothetical protein